jgi:hypothetical protein
MDFNQLINDPSLCTNLQASGLLQYVGVAVFPVVTQIVDYFKTQWPATKRLAPFVAQFFAVLANLGVGQVAGLPVTQSVLLGIATGLPSNIYHDVKKPSTSVL